ncbi:phosphatidate cytidylyltransferase [Bordetella genomosp. 11]|uniref:Phosphatidate cytidylyltransferase n=1 Tax=Bordetella genomosp. 11 TaxID=1416808 RepID=A0A261UEH7_9BORD|nr:phosphatidate cytidylyltransferase [Bordetella genomosp. 11]OZI60348.1 phosphatidate cytidylyltransferase [Bordetella genomosp. 11]
MLRQRIVTAVILLAVLAATMAAPTPWPFMALLALATACAGWEWARLTLPAQGGPGAVAVGAVLGIAALCVTFWWTGGSRHEFADEASRALLFNWFVPLSALLWIFGGTTAVVRGRSDAPPASMALTLFAILALMAAWAVLALLFMTRGPVFLLTLLALVWAADIAAYFGGRALGRHKLAPRVSPGKTIEGAICGILAAVAWIGISSHWDGTFGHALVERWTLWGALPIAALLGAVSIVGDLFESLLKRRAGRKDSSSLLPGHGGVYDRIDAILPVAPIALLLSGVLF